MENTQATRAATRGKIGPWFVWQARNPSAPGMNWATLLGLIERGRITPRSVLRGPTTGQLWRFAARVKGVSREFGICWHCGAEIEKVARLCHACKRLQQPPINPDNLLESDFPVAQLQPTARAAVAGPLVAQPPIHEGRPLPTAPAELLDGSLRIVDVDRGALPSGAEMRSFTLPDDYVAPASPSGRLWKKLLGAAVIAILCGVAAGGYSPPFRDAAVRWYRSAVVKLVGQPSTTVGPQQAPLTAVPTPVREPIPAMHREAATQGATRPSQPPALLSMTATSTTRAATEPSLDQPTTERWAWERYLRAVKYEQQEEYGQAIKDYEWILDLRLPEGVGPSDVQARLDRARQLQRQKAH